MGQGSGRDQGIVGARRMGHMQARATHHDGCVHRQRAPVKQVLSLIQPAAQRLFSHIGQADGHRFVPSGILGLTETDCANVQNLELASEFA